MPNLTVSPLQPKPGETLTVTLDGYSAGESRTVAITVAGVEVKRVVTRKASFTTTIPGLPAFVYTIAANGMLGCAQQLVTVKDAAPPPPPPVDPPPTSGIPAVIPGDLFTHDFGKDGMGPFRGLTYPNDHEADNDPMLGWKEYRNPSKGRWLTQKFVTGLTSIHDGYLDLRCTPPSTGHPTWEASFVGTFSPSTFTKSFTPPFLVRYCIRFDLAGQDCEWPGAWVYRTWIGGDAEIPDWPEVYGRKANANLHVPGKTTFASIPVPVGWHVYGALVLPDRVDVSLDGALVKSQPWAVGTKPAGLFLDAKAGLAAPPASPKPFGMHTAWVSVASA